MKGMDLAKQYYTQYGKPSLMRDYPGLFEKAAFGLAGEGSDCFGYDDEFSRDHDFGPGFCIWLADDEYEQHDTAFARWYSSLPAELMGYAKKDTVCNGSQHTGVMRSTDFYHKYTRLGRAPETMAEWMKIPESFAACATNGQVFDDVPGQFSEIRQALLAYYPQDVRLKKMAARAAAMAQAGQYNYKRCLMRKDSVAATLALAEFLQSLLSMVYLLHKKYMPFYKWAGYGVLHTLKEKKLYKMIEKLSVPALDHSDTIDELCAYMVRELNGRGLSDVQSDFLMDHAEAMMWQISDPLLKKLHIMVG